MEQLPIDAKTTRHLALFERPRNRQIERRKVLFSAENKSNGWNVAATCKWDSLYSNRIPAVPKYHCCEKFDKDGSKLVRV